MTVTINIPSPLRRLAGGGSSVSVDGGTVGQALLNLEAAFPSFKGKLIDADGAAKKAVRFHLKRGGAERLADTGDPLEDGDEITLVPAAFGG